VSEFQSVASLLRWKRFGLALEGMRRTLHVGNYWNWIEVPELAEGIAITELVCPLRYDVYVRREFLSFYRAHRDLYENDFEAFVQRARASSYYIWYMQSEAVRCNAHLRDHPDALEQAFAKRIRRSVELYQRITREGYSAQYPITLKSAERLLPPTTDRAGPSTGKSVSNRYFLADGCHRVAVLMELGYRVIPAEFFRVKCYREFSPFDSTSLLARALPLDERTYFRYLSTRYCAPRSFERRDPFLNYIQVQRPYVFAEVLSVVLADGFLVKRPNASNDSRKNGHA